MADSGIKKPQHHFIHDFTLVKSLIISWLAVLLAGALLHQGIRFFNEQSFSYSTSSDSSSDTSWKHLESHGDLELLRRPIVVEEGFPFKPAVGLYAYRAVGTVDIPIESLLHVFRDTPNNVS